MTPYFLIIDQGTSGTKSFLFNTYGEICFSEKTKHKLKRSKLLHVEADPIAIAEGVKKLIKTAIYWTKEQKGEIISAGFSVQRSTFLFWDKKTCQPLTPALSWQDNRAHYLLKKFNMQAQTIYKKTGIPLSAHFGALKYVHLLNEYSELESMINQETVYFGPLSSYLIHILADTALLDHSIAGRSQLFSRSSLGWDKYLCELFNINFLSLPPLVPTIHNFGKIRINNNSIPIFCVIGDQQAALMGDVLNNSEQISVNLGTSGSVQYYTGSNTSFLDGLLSNLLWSSKCEHHFFIEGTINSGNSLFYWLEDFLNIPHKKMQWDKRCKNTETNGILVPAFTGIASPYWTQPKKTLFYNLEGASDNEIIRAGMESIGFLVYDIIQTLIKSGFSYSMIHAGGGGSRSPLLQFIADLLGVPVKLSKQKDKTAVGVYRLLFFNKFGEFPDTPQFKQKEFLPKITSTRRKEKIERWNKALTKAGVKL